MADPRSLFNAEAIDLGVEIALHTAPKLTYSHITAEDDITHRRPSEQSDTDTAQQGW